MVELEVSWLLYPDTWDSDVGDRVVKDDIK